MATKETIPQDEPLRALNVELPEDLIRALKIEAIHRGVTIKTLVTEMLSMALGLPDAA
jgi:predicted DNA binding CopG/RHH family protein